MKVKSVCFQNSYIYLKLLEQFPRQMERGHPVRLLSCLHKILCVFHRQMADKMSALHLLIVVHLKVYYYIENLPPTVYNERDYQ